MRRLRYLKGCLCRPLLRQSSTAGTARRLYEWMRNAVAHGTSAFESGCGQVALPVSVTIDPLSDASS